MSDADQVRATSDGEVLHLRPAKPRSVPISSWSGLSNPGMEPDYCSTWLALQCARLEGAAAGLVAIPQSEAEALAISATWPAKHAQSAKLVRLAELALSKGQIAVTRDSRQSPFGATQQHELLVAVPIGSDEITAIAVVMITSTRDAPIPTPESIAEQIRWGGGWLTAVPWARQSSQASARLAIARSCMDLLVTVGEHDRLQGTAVALVNDLATRLQCDRVSLGLLRRNGAIRLRSISHSSRFKNEGRLVDAIENVMEEAVDQRKTVAYPSLPSAGRTVTLAHQALTEVVRARGPLVMTVVIPDGRGHLIGAITFERHRDDPFDEQTMELAEVSAILVGPVLRLQLQSNRLFGGRVVDHVGDGAAAVLGRGRPSLKLAALGILGLGLILPFVNGEHRVTATAVLEPQLQRTAVAPFDGYIRSAAVRAGDRVSKGQVLAVLDDRELVLDQLKWRAERDKLVRKQRDALAKHERTDMVILASQLRQAGSLLALAEEKLSRTQIVAPFDGLVVAGDLSQTLGSPVRKGDVLFEIAPLDSYRVNIHVDENDVPYVSVGQSGRVALAGSPGTPLPLVVSKIMPVAETEKGKNSLQVEARLTESDPRLQPGMEGVAKIDAGQRSLLWIWTHGVTDAIRLAAWKYLP